ncbi:DUF3313 family protein [Seongchinamella sediminis]|uniref:DUF3313 family protein n=1 Tax=Seongchinamella sediminis TaxID=2283635 RepID=A0A3L7E342_9GAMM|nr:DUF3313 family protein [Seongchinamella sediminis]RLQ22843.1 DUF3313 family protein [Seongchinamella sediminis]
MKSRRYLVLALPLSLLVACSTPRVEQQPATEFASAGLHRASDTGFESAFILPQANLPAYGEVLFEPFNAGDVEVSTTTQTGTTRRDWQMTAEREDKLVAAWRNATRHAFADYPRTGEAGKRLAVAAALTRLSPGRATNTSAASPGSSVSSNRDVVHVSIEIRLFDGESGQLLAVVRDRQSVGAAQWSRAAGTDMTNLFNSWAALLHTRVSGR